MRISVNLQGMDIWNLLNDNYDHTQLAPNWDAIDNHDHTTGKGLPINTAALVDHSVTNVKLATNAVEGHAGIDSINIVAGTINATDIAPGSLNSTLLDPTIFNAIVPLGTVISWFRPDQTVNIPSGFVICDGSTYSAGQHEFPVAGSVTVPDMRNKFALGAVAGNPVDNGPNAAPGERTTGGHNQQSLSHTHSIAAHSHTHSHSHTVGDHAHPIVADSHSHFFQGQAMHTRTNAFISGLTINDTNSIPRQNLIQSTYITNIVPSVGDDAQVLMDSYGHSHGGTTLGSGGLGTSDASNINTSTTALQTGGPDVGLPSDLRVNFYSLLFLVKIKHS